MTGFSRDYRGKCTDGAALWGRFVADKRSGCVLDGDLEGIVSKRLGSRYVSGRTRAWLILFCKSGTDWVNATGIKLML